MDQFNVPKNINRHVFNAIDKIQSSECGFASVNAITEFVKNQLRSKKSKKDPRLNEFINESLHNMTELGVVDCIGSQEYAIRYILKGYNLRSSRLKFNSKGTEKPITESKPSLMEKVICRECHSQCLDLLQEYRSIELINPMLNETNTDC